MGKILGTPATDLDESAKASIIFKTRNDLLALCCGNAGNQRILPVLWSFRGGCGRRTKSGIAARCVAGCSGVHHGGACDCFPCGSCNQRSAFRALSCLAVCAFCRRDSNSGWRFSAAVCDSLGLTGSRVFDCVAVVRAGLSGDFVPLGGVSGKGSARTKLRTAGDRPHGRPLRGAGIPSLILLGLAELLLISLDRNGCGMASYFLLPPSSPDCRAQLITKGNS